MSNLNRGSTTKGVKICPAKFSKSLDQPTAHRIVESKREMNGTGNAIRKRTSDCKTIASDGNEIAIKNPRYVRRTTCVLNRADNLLADLSKISAGTKSHTQYTRSSHTHHRCTSMEPAGHWSACWKENNRDNNVTPNPHSGVGLVSKVKKLFMLFTKALVYAKICYRTERFRAYLAQEQVSGHS